CRDLLGAVRMTVEAGLAEHEFQPPSELTRCPLDLGTQTVKAYRLVARRAPDPGGRAVLAEAFAQGEAPFAGGDAGFGADNGGGHDVAVLARRRAQLLERRGDLLLVARVAPRLEALDLRGFGMRRRPRGGGSRGACGWRRLVPHDPMPPPPVLLAAFAPPAPPRVRLDKLLFHIAVIDGGNGPAERFDMCQLFLGLALEPLDLLGDR